MTIDIQVVFPQQAVHLSNIRIFPGPPRTIDVTGADFGAVDEVYINRVLSPDVVVLSKNRLIAQVPDSQLTQALLSVTVLSRRLTLGPRSVLRFRLGKRPGKVTGILRLVQKYLKILFTTPGTDIFNPKIGGGALRTIGQTFGTADGSTIVNDLVIAVDTTTKNVISLQSRNPSLPLDERLLSAKILRAGFNKEEGAIDVAVEITSQAGRAATANLEL